MYIIIANIYQGVTMCLFNPHNNGIILILQIRKLKLREFKKLESIGKTLLEHRKKYITEGYLSLESKLLSSCIAFLIIKFTLKNIYWLSTAFYTRTTLLGWLSIKYLYPGLATSSVGPVPNENASLGSKFIKNFKRVIAEHETQHEALSLGSGWLHRSHVREAHPGSTPSV